MNTIPPERTHHLMKYPVGYTFTPRGKNRLPLTVHNFLVTTNLNGTIVKTEYLCTKDFCGQIVVERVCQTTIDLGTPASPHNKENNQ